MSYIFGRRMRQHAFAQWRRLDPRNQVKGPVTQWLTAQNDRGSVSTVDVMKRESVAIAPDEVEPSAAYERRMTTRTTEVKDMASGIGTEKGKGRDEDMIASY